MASVDPAVLDNVLAYFIGFKAWSFKKRSDHRHAGFFVRHRAYRLCLARCGSDLVRRASWSALLRGERR